MKRGDKMNKIFIVEDEKTIRDELSIFLSRYGYQIEAPNNFENIIENIKTELIVRLLSI